MAVIERASPSTVEEVSALVRRAAERGWRVAPIGGGTSRATPLLRTGWTADLEIDLSGLAGIVEHRHADLVARVWAGTRIVDLERALAERAQRWPVAPVGDSTLGGTLSSDRRSPRALRFGRARDWVIGTTIVRFDGAVVHSGGSVVKNVSGYDLSKLYLGAWGSLGILVEASVKLDPTPEAARAIEIHGMTSEAAIAIARQVRVLCSTLSASLLRQAKGEQVSIVLLFEGARNLIETDAARAETIANKESARTHVEKTMATRESSSAAQALTTWSSAGDSSWVVRVEHAPNAEGELCRNVGRMEHAPDVIRCELGCGVARLEWFSAAEAPRLLGEARELARSIHGWAAVESAPDNIAVDAAPPLVDPVLRRVSAEIKRALDPAGMFPPLPIAAESIDAA